MLGSVAAAVAGIATRRQVRSAALDEQHLHAVQPSGRVGTYVAGWSGRPIDLVMGSDTPQKRNATVEVE